MHCISFEVMVKHPGSVIHVVKYLLLRILGNRALYVQQRSLLTCMFVCELDEAVGDVSPSVEANHLGLHIPTGRLKQKQWGELVKKGGNIILLKPLISPETWLFCAPVKLCCYDELTKPAAATFELMID